jgi:flagellar basal-body rod modification protein FlgD
MSVSGVTNPTVTNPNATDAASAQATLSDNFSTFLTLLTSQLQNQDPLSPMDSTQFTQQLVQFSQVEQQIKTNQNLEDLTQQFQAASTSAALSYLGKEAVIQSDTTYSSGSGGSWGYSLPTTADTLQIEVRDASNQTATSCLRAIITSPSPPRTPAAPQSRQPSPSAPSFAASTSRAPRRKSSPTRARLISARSEQS